jgi:hypothetical protein
MSIKQVLHHLNQRSTRLFPSINTLTKIIFVTIIAITLTSLTTKILAANNIIKQTQDAQNKSNNAEAWDLNSWNTNSVNVLTSLTGEIPFKDDGSVDTSKYKVSGLLGTSTNMIASLYNPQASGVAYMAQIKDNFLGKPAYAQGVSFNQANSLQPLLPIWTALRNTVYVLFSLVFVVIGIMIMLRVKISPQAVITIQSAIPKLVASLILVTFSYAISGLIIDLSYWFQGFVIALLFTAKKVDFGQNLFNSGWNNLLPIDMIPGQNWWNFNGLNTTNFVGLSMLANRTVPMGSLLILGTVIGQVVLGSIIGGIGGLFGSTAGFGMNIVGGAIGWVVGAAGGIIFMIILFILIAVWLIKLFFGLLKTYVAILIKIITGPLEIGLGAFPNSKIGFSSWIIDLISKVAVFPVVLIALIFINYLIEISWTGNLWVPSLLNTGPINGNAGGQYIGAAIGLAGLAMLSKLPDLVPQVIFQLKPSAFGSAIGEGFKGGAVGQLTRAGSTVKNAMISNVMDSRSRRAGSRTTTRAQNNAQANAQNSGTPPSTDID